MKIKIVLLTMFLLALGSNGFAQKKKPAAAVGPAEVVKNLYAAQRSDKTNPFANIKSRALVDKYFIEYTADLIWKTSTEINDGWRHLDLLYGSHAQLGDSRDPQITNLVIGKPMTSGKPRHVLVEVKFKDHGEARMVQFVVRHEDDNKSWKIVDIYYEDGDALATILLHRTDAEIQKEYDDDQFKGDYLFGEKKCNIVRAMGFTLLFYRMTCEGQSGFSRLYVYVQKSDENQTVYSYIGEKETPWDYADGKRKTLGEFIFKRGEKDGKFIDAAGKEVKVTRVQ